MKKTECKKSGMILGEVVFALFICGIIMGISIHMFKSNDVSKTPYIYSVLKNLPAVNKAVSEDCYRDGTCTNPNVLPDSITEYCTRLSENFVTSGAVDCNTGIAVTGSLTGTNGNSISFTGTGGIKQNFRLTNGTSFDNITSNANWKTTDGSNEYIDVLIDINGGNAGKNQVGNDIFPIRIYKNGEVIPSNETATNSHTDEEFFSYRVVLNRAVDENNPNSRINDVADARTAAQINDDLPFREKVSFQEAICISNPDLITGYFGTKASCEGFNLAQYCDFSDASTNPYKNDKTAYCTVEPVRPRGSGIFKIFGI